MASESQAALLCSHVNENDGSALGTNLSFENQLKKLLRPIGEPNVDFGQHAINQKQWILKRYARTVIKRKTSLGNSGRRFSEASAGQHGDLTLLEGQYLDFGKNPIEV